MAISSERREARRQILIEAAQALIRERGDAGFSMAQLAKKAGVSPATPYNLLGSKSEILRLVVRADIARYVHELEGRAGKTPMASLLIAVDRLVDHYEADRQFQIALFRAAFGADAQLWNILSTENWPWWNAMVEAAAESGEIASRFRPQQLTSVLLRMMGGVLQTWLSEAWAPDRFALEMSVSARLVLASVSDATNRQAMTRDIAAMQAAIDALPSDRPRAAATQASEHPE